MKAAEIESLETRRLRRSERMERESESSGLFGSIRRILAVMLSVFENRVELAAIELQEFKGRALALFFWGIVLVFLAFLTVVALMATVVFLFWDNALGLLIGFCIFFLERR